MKKIIIILCGLIGLVSSCNHKEVIPVEKIVYVPVKDTISEKENIAKIIELEHKCNILQDSINNIKSVDGEELFVAKYKLARIKYYTDIAGKGANLKYLRGWIYRVLNK